MVGKIRKDFPEQVQLDPKVEQELLTKQWRKIFPRRGKGTGRVCCGEREGQRTTSVRGWWWESENRSRKGQKCLGAKGSLSVGHPSSHCQVANRPWDLCLLKFNFLCRKKKIDILLEHIKENLKQLPKSISVPGSLLALPCVTPSLGLGFMSVRWQLGP